MAEEWVEALNERVQFVHVAVDHEAADGGVEVVLPPALPEGATVDMPADDDDDTPLLESPPKSALAMTVVMLHGTDVRGTLHSAESAVCTVVVLVRADVRARVRGSARSCTRW